MPYRNAILHGRDLNYANEYVSCKLLALMFAVADWMKMKNSEEQSRRIYRIYVYCGYHQYDKCLEDSKLWRAFKVFKTNVFCIFI